MERTVRVATPDRDAAFRLDDTDKAIIQALQEDGRMSYKNLAPLVGLSAPAVRQRVLQLVDGGAIQIVAVTDPTTLGFDIQAMLGLKAIGELDAISAAAAEMTEVDYLVVTTGRFDMLIEIVCETNQHMLETVNRIRSIPGVSEVEVFSYISLVKQTYDWGTR
jgi:Lrp/AsnC family transcriptional regulator for asnA, asnC and gidA